MADGELTAMQTLLDALSPLDEAARRRVVIWAADKFSLSLAREPSAAPMRSGEVGRPSAQFEDFADLFHLIAPKTDKEKAVVGSYWLRSKGELQFLSQELNSMLKQLGYGVGNITDALTAAMRDKPALIIQMKKAGSSRQARKSYKITDAGVRWVEARLQVEEG